MVRRFFQVLSAAAVLALFACGDDPSSAPPGGLEPQAACALGACGEGCEPCGDGLLCLGGACVGADTCDMLGVEVIEASATYEIQGLRTVRRYRAQTRAQAPWDEITVEVYEGGDHAFEGPGVYDLAATDYASCSVCVLAHKGCSEAGCARVFLPDQGQIEITAAGDAGGGFSATISGARFREVYIDSKDLSAIVMPGGESWCIDEHGFSEAMTDITTDVQCVGAGTGKELDSLVGDFQLQNCLGDWVALHTSCGIAKAVWLMAVAGWCESCDEQVPLAAAYHTGHVKVGLELMVVLGEDLSGLAPSQQYCLEYAESHDIDPSLVYMDNSSPNGAWQMLFAHVNPGGGAVLGLPWNGVLRGSDMGYVWTSTLENAGSVDMVLDTMLGK